MTKKMAKQAMKNESQTGFLGVNMELVVLYQLDGIFILYFIDV